VSRFRFIAAEKANHKVVTMCRVLQVSRSGFYAWSGRPPSPRALRDRELIEQIRDVHTDSRGTYGAPRVHAELVLGRGFRLGRKRVARLMRSVHLQGIHRRSRLGCTRRDPLAALAEDLVGRSFTPAGPDLLWVADITQHHTWQGWWYCAVVIDAYSRKVVGWSMAEHLRAELVIDAVDMAVWNRRPSPGLVHHSDHGAQYTSFAFGRRLRESGILGSMGTIGDALDNAVAESFFATLQTELLDRRSWPTRRILTTAAFDYIEGFYNRTRRHSTLGYRSPAEYERITVDEAAS
jgi:transposase InsO family protein